MAFGIRAEQRDTRSCVRVVEDLIQPKRISGIAVFLRGGFCRRQAKAAPPDSKQRLSPESHELFSSLTKRRAAARSFECTEWDFCCRQAKTAPPNSKRRHHELRCSLMRREAALMLEAIHFRPPSNISDLGLEISPKSNSRRFREFVFSPSGERSLRRVERKAKLKSFSKPIHSPRAASFSSQTPTSKFKNRFFGVRRAPTLHEKFSRINRKSSRECEPCANGFILTRQTSDRRNSLMRVFKFRSSR
ncbi:hypothetical protein R3P38DRAFT_2799938 [Favolaschia claudopus]|uniref:Uncharacterized protein n=1 Tax=Favolaschia claudopus TaxID=2862362 RepID=A0AAV9ZZM1_9AGAR